MLVKVANDVSLTFGTLFLRRRLDALLPRNPELINLAIATRDQQGGNGGMVRSNAGGWHSGGNIFTEKHPAIIELAGHIRSATKDISMLARQLFRPEVQFRDTLYGWFNINKKFDYNISHYHPGTTWSGVYYIQIGQDDPDYPLGGQIEFVDPRPRCEVGPNKAVSHAGVLRIKPEAGALLVFPSYLEHYVHPNYGDTERINIAFNSLVEELN